MCFYSERDNYEKLLEFQVNYSENGNPGEEGIITNPKISNR